MNTKKYNGLMAHCSGTPLEHFAPDQTIPKAVKGYRPDFVCTEIAWVPLETLGQILII
jgi:hypothetical protein